MDVPAPPGGPRLGPGREFDLIRRFLDEAAPLPPGVEVGPGDDAAVLEGGWVLSTDLSVEDVHFRRAWLSDREIGHRAAAAAFSDLAAMAAVPVGLLLSIALPRGGGVDVLELTAGARAVAEALGAGLIGGDLSRSPGPLALDVVVLGRTDRPVLRAGARPGDELWVTGRLGASAAALRLLQAGTEPPAALREAFARPAPRVAVATALAGGDIPRAMLDLSDGLAGDAGHLAAAGGVRIVLEPGRVPVHPAVVEAVGEDEGLALALHGGEDYELCFAARAGAVDADGLAGSLGVPLTRVGRVEEGAGVWSAVEDRRPVPLAGGGFDHMEDAG